MNGELHLTVQNKTWNEVVNGRMKFIYRDTTKYFRDRIQKQIPYKVTLRKEYTNIRISYEVLGVTVGYGDPKYGCDEKKKYYIIQIGKRV